ncbi:MAG TPA: hypothetical protein VNK96_07610 [Fimbriimonadales bacterium]|nr:hypothetical protein [Fimbriimonadales bacterium]
MTRRSIRWIVFSLLSLLVVGSAIYSWISNTSLLQNLRSDDPKVYSSAFGILYGRADSPRIFLELPVDERIKIAHKLASWEDSRSSELIIKLLEDPEPRVRSELTTSLSESAKRFPKVFLERLNIGNTTQKAGIIEASFRAGETGMRIAEQGFIKPELRTAAEEIFLRFGAKSYPSLSKLLMSEDFSIAIEASAVLSRISKQNTPKREKENREISERLLQLYNRTKDRLQKNRLIMAMSAFPSMEMKEIFLEKSRNVFLPSTLRASCIRALAQLEEWQEVSRFLADYDEEVFDATAESLARLSDKGIAYVLKSKTSPSRIAKALAKNESKLAEALLLNKAAKNDLFAAKALSERKKISESTLLELLRLIRAASLHEKTRIYIARAISKSEQGKKELDALIHDPIAGYSAYFVLNTR